LKQFRIGFDWPNDVGIQELLVGFSENGEIQQMEEVVIMKLLSKPPTKLRRPDKCSVTKINSFHSKLVFFSVASVLTFVSNY